VSNVKEIIFVFILNARIIVLNARGHLSVSIIKDVLYAFYVEELICASMQNKKDFVKSVHLIKLSLIIKDLE